MNTCSDDKIASIASVFYISTFFLFCLHYSRNCAYYQREEDYDHQYPNYYSNIGIFFSTNYSSVISIFTTWTGNFYRMLWHLRSIEYLSSLLFTFLILIYLYVYLRWWRNIRLIIIIITLITWRILALLIIVIIIVMITLLRILLLILIVLRIGIILMIIVEILVWIVIVMIVLRWMLIVVLLGMLLLEKWFFKIFLSLYLIHVWIIY